MSTPSPTPVETETEEPPLFAPFYGFSQHSWGSSESGISSFLLVYLALLSLCLLAAYYLDHLKHRRASLSPAMRFVSAYVSESGAIILIGALAGALLTGIDSAIEADPDALSVGLLQFSSTTFFLLLLPPIIFNSGYHINRGLFFPLLPAISAYAIIGTTVSAVVVGVGLSLCRGLFGASFAPSTAELLAFGALISATDPVSTLATFQSKKVDPVLFYLVFGESVVNDAVGLVLFETLKKFVGYEHDATSAGIALLDFCVIFFGSTVLGILVGMVSSCLFRRVDFRPCVREARERSERKKGGASEASAKKERAAAAGQWRERRERKKKGGLAAARAQNEGELAAAARRRPRKKGACGKWRVGGRLRRQALVRGDNADLSCSCSSVVERAESI
jgi:hypothetical protein